MTFFAPFSNLSKRSCAKGFELHAEMERRDFAFRFFASISQTWRSNGFSLASSDRLVQSALSDISNNRRFCHAVGIGAVRRQRQGNDIMPQISALTKRQTKYMLASMA